MKIDMHSHIFPPALAPRTLARLSQMSGLTPSTDGTLEGMLADMHTSGVDLSVNMPVLTKPSQFDHVNAYAEMLNTDGDAVLSFGGTHPDREDPAADMAALREMGFRGVKLHPDYQMTYIDDERYLRILRECRKQGLYVVFHAGVDVGMPPDIVRCPPQRARKMLDELYRDGAPDEPEIILAHLGGADLWDDVETYLVGQPVYFDLSFILGRVSREQLLRIIRHHGAEKILFGTDSPWSSAKEDVAYFDALPLTEEEKRLISEGNARRILRI